MRKAAAPETSCIRTYFTEVRSVSLNLLFILPLLVLYEIGILATGSDFRNGAEVILKDMDALIGKGGLRWFHWFLIGLAAALLVRAILKQRPIVPYYLLMVSESLFFALVLGPLLACSLGRFLLEFPLTSGGEPGLSVRLLLSIGAGVYEELLFRFFLLGSLFLVFIRVFRAPVLYGGMLAVLISSFLFAAYHHLGPYGQMLSDPYPLFFRFAAGCILGVVFVTRGLGVAVYLHVFYDILRDIELLMQGAGS